MEASVDQLKQAMEGQHGGTAVLSSVEPVKEVRQGKTVWQGEVHVFDLQGNTRATRAYAWSSAIEGTERWRFHAVLHLGEIRSPLDAVRAAIVAERRADEHRSSASAAAGKRQDAVVLGMGPRKK